MTDTLKVQVTAPGAKEAAAEVRTFGETLRAAKEIAGTFGSTIAGAARAVIDGTIAHEQQQRALEQLGSAYARVSEATRGAITAQQALKTQQDLVQSGLRVSDQALAAITRTAREYARTTGTDTVAALDKLTGALRNGDAGGLREFGLSVTGTGNRVRDFNRAIDQMTQRQRGVAPAVQSTSEAVQQSSQQWDAFKNSVLAAAGELLHLREVFGMLTSAMDAIRQNGLFESIGEQLANVFDPTGQAQSRQAAFAQQQATRRLQRQNQQAGMAGITSSIQALEGIGLSGRSSQALRQGIEGRVYSETQSLSIIQALRGGDAQAAYEAIQRANQSAGLTPEAQQRQRLADERRESAEMARRRMAGAAEGMNPADPAVVREMAHGMRDLLLQAERANYEVAQVQWRAGESVMSVLRRQTAEFEQHLVNSHNRVYRHRGETDDAFLQRRIAVVQRELAIIEENERGKREAIAATTEAIKAQIDAEQRAKDEAAQQLEITRRQRRGAGLSLIRGLGERATTAGLVQDAEGALGLRGFNPGGAARDTERGALLGRVQSLTEQAANSQDEHTAEQLQAQAQAISEVVGRYDELRRSQQAANDTGFQFAQAFSQHTELVSTSAQTMASVASEAFGTFKNALRQHIGAVLAGKESVGEALRAIAQATLSNLAERALYEGLFETAKGIGKLAASYGADPTAYGHFAAAAGYFGLAALGGLGAYGLSQLGPQSGGAAGGNPAAYTDKPAAAHPSNSNSNDTVTPLVVNINGTVIGSNDEIGRVIAEHVNRQTSLGNIRRRVA